MDAEQILVLGHRGLLGAAVLEACQARCQVVEGGRQAFDLTWFGMPPGPLPAEGEGPPPSQARQSLERLLAELPPLGGGVGALHSRLDFVRQAIMGRRPRLVINCAGYTDVDRAEREPELAWAVNARGAQALARACQEAGSHLVHMSTDYVFDGASGRPYREDDPPAPLSAYGRSKLEGERLVRAELPGALIVRSAWLFGPGRDGFVEKVVAKARQGQPFGVVRDQMGSPTYTRDLARAILELGRRWVGGVLHVVNQGRASRWELARQAVRLAGLDPELVQPVQTAALEQAARRPAFSVLDAGRAARLLGGPLPPWLDSLARHLNGGKEGS